MVEAVNMKTLDSADNYFLSLKSEHRKSPLLGEAILILAKAHMDFEEYKVANYYYDSYIKMFGTQEAKEFAKFMKIKSNYYAFKRANRDQKLLIDTIKESSTFNKEYPNSMYRYEISMLVSRMQLAQISLNSTISRLYVKLDKPLASQKYNEKIELSPLKNIKYKNANIPWYRAPFE